MTTQEVQAIIRRETADDSIDPMDPISMLGDSLEFLHVIGKIEAASGKAIPDKIMASFETVGQLTDWVIS